MEAIKVGINGFGRIGKLFFRSLYTNNITQNKLKVVAINDLMDIKQMAYLLKYDSVHGKFDVPIRHEANKLYVGDLEIHVSHERDPSLIKWDKSGAEYIVECTGLFLTRDLAAQHLKNGAKKVILSAPPKDDTPIFVLGVNQETYDAKKMDIVSNASCTTNCLAPIVKVMHDKYTIVEGLMTTVHAATINQTTIDGISKKDWRGGRSALLNIIPASTGAAKAVGRVIPELAGKLTGMAFRIPSANVSVIDLTCRIEKPASKTAFCDTLREAAASERFKGILAYTEDQVVSQDFLHDAHTSIFDAAASLALNDNFVKLVAWYDNEWGYANKVGELVYYLATRDD
ncbi:glyceraldehyde-3-phosphate dehydrogenase A [Spirochaetota bacterium]|nr:glyceraldehyde-3-phosphate dehydrogenase A [Spirochaetota bacterium]